jgi:hypothetical protein
VTRIIHPPNSITKETIVKYDQQGRAYRLTDMKADGNVAGWSQVDWGDGPEDGQLCSLRESDLYDGAPQLVVAEEVAKLQARRDDLRRQVAELSKELVNAERGTQERLEKLKRLKPLEHVEDFIDGKITHYAIEPYHKPPTIVAVGDAIAVPVAEWIGKRIVAANSKRR